MKRFTSAHYEMHKAALLPVLSGRVPAPHPDAVYNRENFADFLFQQRLHALWLSQLSEPEESCGYANLVERLKKFTLISSARELPQQHVLKEVADVFKAHQIQWFTAKGSLLRHVIYEQPHLRPAIDIDIFVRKMDRERAVQALVDHGFVAKPMAETLSHELKLTRKQADVDLHWHLFRPGRARPGLMEWLFSRREEFDGLKGLDDTASLLVMLVHPAITKYLLSPTSMLIHQVDQAYLIRRGKVDWGELEAALSRSGTQTAAWCSFYILEMLGGIRAPEGFQARIRPSGMKRRYLQMWIDNGLIEKWFEQRWLVSSLFSLALQDNPGDMCRAVSELRKARKLTTPF